MDSRLSLVGHSVTLYAIRPVLVVLMPKGTIVGILIMVTWLVILRVLVG